MRKKICDENVYFFGLKINCKRESTIFFVFEPLIKKPLFHILSTKLIRGKTLWENVVFRVY